jgi:hypothetical protein
MTTVFVFKCENYSDTIYFFENIISEAIWDPPRKNQQFSMSKRWGLRTQAPAVVRQRRSPPYGVEIVLFGPTTSCRLLNLSKTKLKCSFEHVCVEIFSIETVSAIATWPCNIDITYPHTRLGLVRKRQDCASSKNRDGNGLAGANGRGFFCI